MILSIFRWFKKHLSTIVLSLILAIVVWVSAVVISDPNVENTSRAIPVEIVGQDQNMLVIGDIPNQARVTLKAPTSIWNQLDENPNLMRAWVDLSGREAGEHTLPINVQIEASPIRIVKVDPEEVSIILEPLLSKTVPIELIVIGEPPLGYKKDPAQISPEAVQVSGPESAVTQVATARVEMDVSGASQTVTDTVPIQILDENGAPVSDVTVSPISATVIQPVSLLRGFRNVAVKVVTTGQVANGYRLTNLTVTPPTITVSAADPLLVNELPGFIETELVDLTGLTDDIEVNVGLILPEGITLVRDPSVLVQVGVAAIESSLTLTLPVEILGLPPELIAVISPPTVDIIVTGPIPILDTLSPASFRIVIDLTSMEPGVYQLSPVLDLIPVQVEVESILPGTVEVTISIAPTPTPEVTPTDGALGLNSTSPTATPAP